MAEARTDAMTMKTTARGNSWPSTDRWMGRCMTEVRIETEHGAKTRGQ